MCARFAAKCLSADKDAIQYTEDQPASMAVDGDVSTHSCTLENDAFPWWSVDLGQEYIIKRVTITLPNVNGDSCNYLWFCFIIISMNAVQKARI